MKRVITLTVFITLVLIVMLAKTSQAHKRITHVQTAPPAMRIWVPGFWKWSPRLHRHVWVDGRWVATHPRKVVYVRVRRSR